MTLLALLLPAFLVGPLPDIVYQVRLPEFSVFGEVKRHPELHWYQVAVPDSVTVWPLNARVRVDSLESRIQIGMPAGLARPVPLRGPVDAGRLDRRNVAHHGRCYMILAGFDAPVSITAKRVEIAGGPP